MWQISIQFEDTLNLHSHRNDIKIESELALLESVREEKLAFDLAVQMFPWGEVSGVALVTATEDI